jgi:hypothetical protein
MATFLGCTPEELRRESTHLVIYSSSSEIHSSNNARSTTAPRSVRPTEPSEYGNVAVTSRLIGFPPFSSIAASGIRAPLHTLDPFTTRPNRDRFEEIGSDQLNVCAY